MDICLGYVKKLILTGLNVLLCSFSYTFKANCAQERNELKKLHVTNFNRVNPSFKNISVLYSTDLKIMGI